MRGRPFEVGNKYGQGRPRGSRNKTSHSLQQLLQTHGESLVRRCMVEALKGNVQAIRLCLERILPPCRERTVRMPAHPIDTAQEVSAAVARIWKLVSAGWYTPSEAETLINLLERQRRMIEAADFEQRLERIEERGRAA